MSQAGYHVSHLSRPTHGFSSTPFGVEVLNPIRLRLENRYLGERILIPAAGSLGYLRTLERRLHRNGLVSIRSGDHGHQTRALPLLQGGLRLATGAPSLAIATQATLLPVFLRRDRHTFEVVVEKAAGVG